MANFYLPIVNSDSREGLLEGKAQYGWPPCTNQFRLAPFYIENIINLFLKSQLNEEVNCTEPFPLVSFPGDRLISLPWLLGPSYNCTEHIRHLCRKITSLNCHRCLIPLTTSCLYVRSNFGVPIIVYNFKSVLLF